MVEYDYSYLLDRTWWECADCGDVFLDPDEADACWNVVNWPEDALWNLRYGRVDTSGFFATVEA